jgi:integrase
MLKERNVRTGFFEREQMERVLGHLPPAVQPAMLFAFITGWRIPSEVLPLQWRHVDFEARVVRLDPHTTKNDEGRTFPFTDALQQLLESQKAEHDRLRAEDVICPWVLSPNGQEGQGQADHPVHESVEEGLREGRVSWPNSPRLATHSRAQSRACWNS